MGRKGQENTIWPICASLLVSGPHFWYLQPVRLVPRLIDSKWFTQWDSQQLIELCGHLVIIARLKIYKDTLHAKSACRVSLARA